MSLLFYLFTFAVSLWHRKFVTADVAAAFVNKQHGIQRREQFYSLSIHSYTHRGIKISTLKMQFICDFFHSC